MAYLDAASAEPPHPVAVDAFRAALEQGWADPARLHAEGRRAAMLLDHARESVAGALGAYPDEVSFTASGTQAVQLALLGAAEGRRRVGTTVVASAVEHSAVLQSGAHLAAHGGGPLRVVPVDRSARVDPDEFASLLAPDVCVACLQSANHEVGTIQPVEAVAASCAERGIPLLVDAAQSLGRMPIPGGWSLLAASGHKWGGPPGVGVLAVRRGQRWRSPMPGDEREGGRVPGAPNVPTILAAAAALEAVQAHAATERARLHRLVARIRSTVAATVPDVQVVGDPEQRLPHIVTFSCLYVDGEAIVTELSRAGHSVSSGSSCTSSTLRPSHVLEAMGVLTHGNVRVSLPRGVSDEDVDAFLADLPRIVTQLRRSAGVEAL